RGGMSRDAAGFGIEEYTRPSVDKTVRDKVQGGVVARILQNWFCEHRLQLLSSAERLRQELEATSGFKFIRQPGKLGPSSRGQNIHVPRVYRISGRAEPATLVIHRQELVGGRE